MTPRSRKPVLLLGMNNPSSDGKNSSIFKSSSSLNDDDLCSIGKFDSEYLRRSKSEGDLIGEISTSLSTSSSTSLTSLFKEYLLNRKVLASGPADESFCSHPDDFQSYSHFENDMSESMLYCLDGNIPQDLSSICDDNKENSTTSNTCETRKRRQTYTSSDEENTGIQCQKLYRTNTIDKK